MHSAVAIHPTVALQTDSQTQRTDLVNPTLMPRIVSQPDQFIRIELMFHALIFVSRSNLSFTIESQWRSRTPMADPQNATNPENPPILPELLSRLCQIEAID